MFPLKTFCIIVGSMKSGTTTLFNDLAKHPAICPSVVKEPQFFAVEEKYRQGIRDYFNFWSPGRQHSVALEGSNDYSKFPYVRGVPGRLKVLEEAGYALKFVYVMRHPIERIKSHIRHLFLYQCDILDQRVPLAPLEAGIIDRYVALSSYAYQLDQFAGLFARTQFHLVSFERMLANRSAVIDETFAFLELPPNAVVETKASNVSEAIRVTRGYYRLLSDIPLIKRAISPVIPQPIKAYIKGAVARPYPYRTSLTKEEKAIIAGRLRPDLARLEDDWGFEHRWDVDR